MSAEYKLNLKRRHYPLQYSHRSFKRQLKRFLRILVLNSFVAVGIFMLGFIIMSMRFKGKQTLPHLSEDIIFQPLAGELNLEGGSLNWKENIQFEMPEVKGERKDWHDYAAIAADRRRSGPGEQGEPVYNTDESLEYIEEHMALENGFNALISDLISVNRSVPDLRGTTCHTKRYLAKLPSVSIVIPCRNEYNSVLQRTLHSIVNRTPKKLLKEIIIVDDNSYRGYTIDDMSEYADHHFPNLVKFVRLYERKGLIYARVAGAKIATGDVLIFFDSHIECNCNWLPPLLEPIAINDRISTSPVIDAIDHSNFGFILNSDASNFRGGFNWDLTYLYMHMDLNEELDPTKPYKDPVMMGGLFAISRRFFWELGGYDIGLDIWGSEQFELSFKIWMCGGMLLVVPCSHVAHIFRGPWNSDPDTKDYDFLSVIYPKRGGYTEKYSYRDLKRRFRRFLRFMAIYILTILSICLLLAIVISLTKMKRTKFEPNTTENIYFQPLNDHLDYVDPSPHWNDHVQFDVPEADGEKKDWHNYAAMAADINRIGPGEQGDAVYNTEDSNKVIEEQLYLENGFNAIISDLISINRSVPDIRITTCHTKRYLAKLPTVSVVIACRNEYKSVLQRTLHSIVNRTPRKLLKEIIIVDDNSFRGYTVDELSDYANHHFPNLVKFLPLYERKGMVYARVAGAKIATGDVLIFLDSHIECNYNWLPPLLEPIAVNDRIAMTPRIDLIAQNSFAYKSNSDNYGHRGGFDWDLSYIYLPLRLDVGVDPTKPFKDPIMMGGLFAISRRYFWALGGYDIGIDVFGAEQVELSFKIWMCGGMLLVAPCSHVGHIFRGKMNSYIEPKNNVNLKVNNKRVAEVWMDEYKKYVYETNPDVYYKLDPGNLTEQHAVRKRLKCKSFKWYLEFVAPDILELNPIETLSDFANGAIQSVAYPQLCLDSMNRREGMSVGIFNCGPSRVHPHTNQFWNFNTRQELKNHWRNYCLDVYQSSPNADVAMFRCHHQGGNQFWYYDEDRKWLVHGSNGINCLELLEDGDEIKIVVNACSVTNVRMRWIFGFVNASLTPSKYQLE